MNMSVPIMELINCYCVLLRINCDIIVCETPF
jgi:hypothetical protein